MSSLTVLRTQLWQQSSGIYIQPSILNSCESNREHFCHSVSASTSSRTCVVMEQLMLTAQLCMHAQARVPSTVRTRTVFKLLLVTVVAVSPAGALKGSRRRGRGSGTATARTFRLDEEDGGAGSDKDSRATFCYRPTCLLPRQPIGCARLTVTID